MDKIRVLRVIEYVGDRAAVEWAVANSIQGTKECYIKDKGEYVIRTAALGAYPEVLEQPGQRKDEKILPESHKGLDKT